MAVARESKRKKRKRKPARCTAPKKKPKSRRKKAAAKRSAAEPRAMESRRKKRAKAKRKPTCRPKRKRKPAAKKPTPKKAAPKRPVPLQPVPPPPAPPKPPFRIASPVAVYSGPFGVREAERLLWRAGFGPSPGHAQFLAGMGLHAAVASLTRPAGTATLTGAAPTADGDPLSPEDAWGHDHLWFLDRMVRSNQPLMERMTLIWHDWFATSIAEVSQRHMLDQNQMFRRNALGSFASMVVNVTTDPAMIRWLNQDQNTRWDPNENYARELMELFTLGADRGAYTENDVRELARSLTGWNSDWSPELGHHNFRFVADRHDPGNKTVFGRTGRFNWRNACDMCIGHRLHPSFFVEKLWSYFIPVPPSASDRAALEMTYVASGHAVRPVVEAILLHPHLLKGPRMVKPPAVYVAGMLRQQRRAVDTPAWVWLGEGMGQRLFYPPNVAGWNDDKWLDTSTVRGRWSAVAQLLNGRHIRDGAMDDYPDDETPEQAVLKARAFWGDPAMTADGLAALQRFAATCLPASMANWQKHQYRAIRQNALRHLIATSPDLQTS